MMHRVFHTHGNISYGEEAENRTYTKNRPTTPNNTIHIFLLQFFQSKLLTEDEKANLMIPCGEGEDFVLSKRRIYGRGFTYIRHPVQKDVSETHLRHLLSRAGKIIFGSLHFA